MEKIISNTYTVTTNKKIILGYYNNYRESKKTASEWLEKNIGSVSICNMYSKSIDTLTNIPISQPIIKLG